MLQLVLQYSKVLLELEDAVSNDLACLAQLVLVLDMFRPKLSNANHLGKFRIAAGADETCHLFALSFGLELKTLQLCHFAFVRGGFVLDALGEWLERLGQDQHLGQIAEGPLGGIG